MSEYYDKYLKYKNKYIQLKNEMAGGKKKPPLNEEQKCIKAKKSYVEEVLFFNSKYPEILKKFEKQKCIFFEHGEGMFWDECYNTFDKYISSIDPIFHRFADKSAKEDYDKIHQIVTSITEKKDYEGWRKIYHYYDPTTPEPDSEIINALYEAFKNLDVVNKEIKDAKSEVLKLCSPPV